MRSGSRKGMEGIVEGSVWECAILNPGELRQDGQAGVASCART